MAKPKVEVVGRICRSRHARGVSWGGEIVVLARRGDKELWVVPGAHTGRGIGRSYVPGHVALVENAESHWAHYQGEETTLNNESARTSGVFFRTHQAKIDAFFGAPVAHLLGPQKTVIVTSPVRPKQERGTCPYCEQRTAVNAAGLVLAHKFYDRRMGNHKPCPLKGEPSVEQREKSASLVVLSPDERRAGE